MPFWRLSTYAKQNQRREFVVMHRILPLEKSVYLPQATWNIFKSQDFKNKMADP